MKCIIQQDLRQNEQLHVILYVILALKDRKFSRKILFCRISQKKKKKTTNNVSNHCYYANIRNTGSVLRRRVDGTLRDQSAILSIFFCRLIPPLREQRIKKSVKRRDAESCCDKIALQTELHNCATSSNQRTTKMRVPDVSYIAIIQMKPVGIRNENIQTKKSQLPFQVYSTNINLTLLASLLLFFFFYDEYVFFVNILTFNSVEDKIFLTSLSCSLFNHFRQNNIFVS